VLETLLHELRQALAPQRITQQCPTALLADRIEQQLRRHLKLTLLRVGALLLRADELVDRRPVYCSLRFGQRPRHGPHQVGPGRQPRGGRKPRADKGDAGAGPDVLEQARIDLRKSHIHCDNY
jgi:hypothetical protein